VEGADQVLAVRRVDAGLAADRGIDLRQQGGGDLHEAHAAAHGRRREARQVPDDAAAERHHEVAALDAGGQDAVADPRPDVEGFRRLAGRDGDHRGGEAVRLEGPRQRLPVEGADMAVGDDRGGAGAERRDPGSRLGEQPAPDQDVVGPPAERDVDRRDGADLGRSGAHAGLLAVSSQAFRARATSCTTRSWGASCDSTIRSACA
jgi:hypothetical protein